MWRIALRKSSRKLNSVKEISVLPCQSSVCINEKPEASKFRKSFSFDLFKPVSLQGLGFCVDNGVNLTAVHSLSGSRIENEGFRDLRSVMDPPWRPCGARAFVNSAAEVVVSSDVDDEGSMSASCSGSEEERSSRFEWRMKQGKREREEDGEKCNALRIRQIKIETEAWQQAVVEYKELLTDMCASKLAPNLPFMKSLLLGWFEPLRDAIAAEQRDHIARKWKLSFGEYMCQLPPDKMAVITMHKLIGMMMTDTEHGSVKVVYAALQVGEAVENEVRIHKFLEKTKKKSKRRKKVEEDEQESITKDQEVLRKRVKDLIKKGRGRKVRKILKGSDDSPAWNLDARAKVGSRLIEILLQTAFIQPPLDQSAEGTVDIRPAFKHTLKSTTIGKCIRHVGVIECDPLVRRGLDRTARNLVMPYMPMLVRPRPWKGYANGGHLFLHSNVMRTHGAKEQRDAMWRAPFNQMKEVYKALDILGSTKWRVNKRILDVVDRIWAGGGRLAGLIDREDVPLPEKPDTEDEAEIKPWKLKFRKAKKTNYELHSRRCDIELKLSVARKMKDEECFYYPHNLDFRGRAYPMHPHLNHLGSDLSRGILEFAEGRPLGKTGLSWLKIQLANLFATGGVDKLSNDGRIAFVEDNIDNIIDSAEKPLEGKRWWLEAEDPLQCLSACMYLSDALKSSCPESIICHMPIHQDGSCNGLQHYAALGRDKVGAAVVNLVHCDRPADVYTGIANRVDEIMRKDALDDIAINQNADNARLLLGQVDRKLVKQTVMTSVYGVTYVGARDQILRRLKERGFVDDKALFNASCYAAKVTLTALGEMFKSARDIMNWLADCAKIIATENKSVRWTTPLGLPVVQPYRKQKAHHVKTSLQTLALTEETDKVMVNRQKTAFPPNFVHSLDGSHMMMTAIACNEAGLSFAGVHDSYWTHACDVDKMNQILRKKFVELYSKPILENLLDSFERTFPEMSFPTLPDRSDFDLNEVLNSPYFFN